ncbi:CAP domain-containing protein [Ruegeria lacuscaerulensis]|uniref:CAP domain-containing protein n=1 Tax=Ruegeria lacuscaerulensis TaxID=55218 RepID=UPI001479D7F5|nr:CAP domain-containing protein [Ruegeria lacuscaerulensis]
MSTASTFEQEMLALINAERTSRGLNPLQLETRLNDSSEDHSTWMLNTDTFSHTGSGGSSATQRMEGAGFDFSGNWRSGENIAWQSERGADGISDDVAQLHQSLMNSPGHRANILNPDYEYIGIGIEEGDYNGWDAVMVTQNFASTDAAVVLDNGNVPTPPTVVVTEPEMPVAEAPDTDVPGAPVIDAETPVTDVTETEDPGTETPETDVTETEEPGAETPETDVTETDEPGTDTPETDVTETDEPGTDTPETDVTETDEPGTDAPETDVTETEEPGAETPETDVTETEEPGAETPETDVTETDDTETPETEVTETDETETPETGTADADANTGDCFDVAAFLAAIEEFVNDLRLLADDFKLNDTAETGNEPVEDDFMLTGDVCDDTPVSDEAALDTGLDPLETDFSLIPVDGGCMMDFV